MKKARFWLLLGCLVFGPAAAAADLAKVARVIGKEPAYRSKAPEYCLLVFGPEAAARVWLVVDGDTLYGDLNGNGALPEAGETVQAEKPPEGQPQKIRAFSVGEVNPTTAGGAVKYTDMLVMVG